MNKKIYTLIEIQHAGIEVLAVSDDENKLKEHVRNNCNLSEENSDIFMEDSCLCIDGYGYDLMILESICI